MTTICYHHESKTIAVDSRITKGEVICSDNYTKIRKNNGVVFVLAGSASDLDLVVESYPNQLTYKPQVSGYIVEDGKCYYTVYTDDGHPTTLETTWNDSAGSGQDFAMAAMDFGATAKEAVKYATSRDIYSGGLIKTFKIK